MLFHQNRYIENHEHTWTHTHSRPLYKMTQSTYCELKNATDLDTGMLWRKLRQHSFTWNWQLSVQICWLILVFVFFPCVWRHIKWHICKYWLGSMKTCFDVWAWMSKYSLLFLVDVITCRSAYRHATHSNSNECVSFVSLQFGSDCLQCAILETLFWEKEGKVNPWI